MMYFHVFPIGKGGFRHVSLEGNPHLQRIRSSQRRIPQVHWPGPLAMGKTTRKLQAAIALQVNSCSYRKRERWRKLVTSEESSLKSEKTPQLKKRKQDTVTND